MTETAKIDPEAPASLIISKFPSNNAFAQALGRRASTTRRWLVGGSIPAEYHAEVIEAAEKMSVKLVPTDFVDLRLFPKKAAK